MKRINLTAFIVCLFTVTILLALAATAVLLLYGLLNIVFGINTAGSVITTTSIIIIIISGRVSSDPGIISTIEERLNKK